VPPGSAPEVIEVQGTQGVFDIVGHRLEPDPAEEGAGHPLRVCPKVWMRSEEPVQESMGLAVFESLEHRRRLR